MNKICTSIKQSKKLIELGIDVNTADMVYQSVEDKYGDGKWKSIPRNNSLNIGYDDDIPCWSLSALLNLMPKSICIHKTEHSGYFYFLEWQFANDNSLRYVGHDRKCLVDIYSDHDYNYKDEIDTAVEMIVWLKENKKI